MSKRGTNCRDWNIRYFYPHSDKAHFTSFTVKARNEEEAYRKAKPFMRERGVSWDVAIN